MIDDYKAITILYKQNNKILGKYYVEEKASYYGLLFNSERIGKNSIRFNWKDRYGTGKVIFNFKNNHKIINLEFDNYRQQCIYRIACFVLLSYSVVS